MLAHFQRGYAVNLVKPTYLAAGTDKAEIVLADYKIRVENSKAVYMKSQRTKSYLEGSSQVHNSKYKAAVQQCKRIMQDLHEIQRNRV